MRLLALTLVALAVAASASAREERAAACAPTFAGRLETGSATQLVTVVARTRSSTQGTLRLWTKRGRLLARDRRAVDRVARRQRHLAGQARGRPPHAGRHLRLPADDVRHRASPGVHYAYRRVVCGDWWVEDPASPYYNRFRHVRCGSSPPFRTTSEDMSRSPTAYRHLAVIAYNTDPVVPGRGSGIFLHVSTGRPTLGCVSLPLPQPRRDAAVAAAAAAR